MRKIKVTQFHIERSKLEIQSPLFHPVALAINDHLLPGFYAIADDHRIIIKHRDDESKELFSSMMPTGEKLFFGEPINIDLGIDTDALFLPESEVEFFSLRGCHKTDQPPESVHMNPNFNSLDDRNRYWRLIFAMRKVGLDHTLLQGIGKLFFDLGQGVQIFRNPNLPDGYIPQAELMPNDGKELEDDIEWPGLIN